MSETNRLPELGPGSFDASVLHEALARGDDPQVAIEAAREPVPIPEPLDGKTKRELVAIAEAEGVVLDGNPKAHEVTAAILLARHGEPAAAAFLDGIESDEPVAPSAAVTSALSTVAAPVSVPADAGDSPA